MAEIIGVRFKNGGKQYYFDPCGITVRLGEGVIIDTSRGVEYGECAKENTVIPDEELVAPLRPVLRLATGEDQAVVAKNREREERAFRICQQKIAEHGLDMKLVEVEYSFEGNKIMFFFTSEGRVDFRGLVKDLAAIFHTRIELRQIGVRDEAKILGGLGVCGKPFCCATFLDEFQPVSIKMAKTQSLSLNPTKISGTCGRLMCCLKFEQDAYEDAVKRCPKMESFVETPDGVGTVTSVNLLREKVKVRLEETADAPKCYHACEICVVRSGKGKKPDDYVPPPAEELAKRRVKPVGKEETEPAPPSFVRTPRPERPAVRASAEPVKTPPAPERGRSDWDRKQKPGPRRAPESRPERKGPPPEKTAPAQPPIQESQQGQNKKNPDRRPSNRRRWHGKPKPGGENKPEQS